jgi:hypothetical protein
MASAGSSPDGEHYVLFDGFINVGGTRNWRNNNPGNIEAGGFASGQGAIGSDGRFAIFPDMPTGRKALSTLLTSGSYINLSIEEAMIRYAPPTENDTNAYTSFISTKVGVDPSTIMSTLTADQLSLFVDAIYHYEGGTAGATFQAGSAAAPEWALNLFEGALPGEPSPAVSA